MIEKMSDPMMKSSEGKMESMASETAQMMDTAQEKVSERYSAAKDKLKEHWAVAKDDLDVLKQKAIDYSQSAARATNTFAHDHPWTTAGAAVGVGALIGWLVTRRSDMPRSSR
ncbi:MAG TPA: hypothetical protein VJ576_15595 [Rhodocyclaceae bacterium]|nr:hypothetical protein [Rhodocyclaceae bacterium]